MLKLNILVVDDSPVILEMVKDAFEERGFRVLVAPSAEEALDITLRENPDLIISDIAMPGMDGWDFCTQVRTNPYTSFIPFIFLSAKSAAPDRVRGLQLGADDYLTKPFEMEELIARVEQILTRMVKVQEAIIQRESGFKGSTKDMGIPDLLQMFGVNRKTGVLKITHGKDMGRILFHNGQIVGASLGAMIPMKAMYRMLMWDDAKFALEPFLPSKSQQNDPIDSVEGVLMEGFRVADELNRLKKERPIQAFELSNDAFSRVSELTDIQKKILIKARSHKTVEELMEIPDLGDLEIYESILKMMDMGIMMPAANN